MILIPDKVVHGKTRTCCDKKTAFFLLFRRWRKPDTWDDVKIVFRRQRPWCIHIYYALFYLLKEHYEICVLVLDYRCLTPDLLEEWNQTMLSYCDAAKDFLFFVDGKPWRICRPGKGKAANEIMRQVGDQDLNLVQKAYYNGHYRFHCLKVSSVLQADRMRHAYAESLRRHDSVVLHNSYII